jgi:orotate phosphoribosyltransferase
LTIFYHDAFPGTRERLEQAGLKLHALATWRNILDVSAGRLDAADRKLIEDFLADPAAWSGRNGGRMPEQTRG